MTKPQLVTPFQRSHLGASAVILIAALGVIAIIVAAILTIAGPKTFPIVQVNENLQVVQVRDDGFRQVQRPGSVSLDEEYDLAGLTIPRDEIHTLLPRDAIPALTDPALEPATEADWLPDSARMIEVKIGGEVLGVPLRILNWHEIVNITLGGEPIAVTYCPLCDSASVFSRRVRLSDTKTVTLEFGVSGALYNSNVIMYDRKDRGLWSQLAMHAISGPLAGTALDMLPVRLVLFSEFKQANPGAPIVSKETGHNRNYHISSYEDYFAHDRLLVPVAGVGDILPMKTLGVGVATDDQAWFVPQDIIGDKFTLTTPVGPVEMTTGEAGVSVNSAPTGVRYAQTFYYSWSAFYPQTKVVCEKND